MFYTNVTPSDPKHPKLTLEQFRATGKDVPDLRVAVDDERWEPTTPGRIYEGILWIERTATGWFTSIERSDYTSPEAVGISRLEELLYAFYCAEIAGE